MVRCADCQKDLEWSQFEEDHLAAPMEATQTARLERRRAVIRLAVERLDEDETLSRASHYKDRYQMTQAEVIAMEKAQGNRCPICQRGLAGLERRGHIDHDHKTGRVRGILCARCNVGIGYFKDDPARLRRALEYLEAPLVGKAAADGTGLVPEDEAVVFPCADDRDEDTSEEE